MANPAPMMTTDEQLREAQQEAQGIILRLMGKPNPVIVAALALALAGSAHVAECGPEAPAQLFEKFYRTIASMKGDPVWGAALRAKKGLSN